MRENLLEIISDKLKNREFSKKRSFNFCFFKELKCGRKFGKLPKNNFSKFPLIICFIIFCFNINFELYSKGKMDIEIPSENVEYALKGVEEIEEKIKEPLYNLRSVEGNPIYVKESWGYVMAGREGEYNSSFPLTDVCYFAAEVNSYGELTSIPNRSKLKTGNTRCHLVIACDSKTLTHFVLNGDYNLRQQLIKDIVKASQNYDGVQIDFELVPARDRKNFITFLADLRYLLGQKKWFSVCVPARFKLLTDDIYPYAEIAKYCDRVFVMAYDEHWSGSKSGAIASLDFCKKVAEYAKKAIPERKLVMGLPFYGRTWASETTAGAWYFSGANRIMTEHSVEDVFYEEEIPTFKYTAQVEVTGYFNDAYSCVQIARLYENLGIQKIGYWRIGQEDPEFWNWIICK